LVEIDNLTRILFCIEDHSSTKGVGVFSTMRFAKWMNRARINFRGLRKYRDWTEPRLLFFAS
jgi:hypothetical protein